MYYNQACAAKGEHGSRNRNLQFRSMQRALVNIQKTDNSYNMLIFAPGRIKEHFSVAINGAVLTIAYQPPAGFPKSNWILREYSRGGFERTFTLDESIDAAAISAKYEDGVLQVNLPIIAGKEQNKKEIVIN